MAEGLFQPVGQVRLTNVAVVKLKKGGKRFEIACYKNKVLNWRNGVETDIGEVLQIDHVFENVSKGKVSSKKDLIKVFGTNDQEKVCKIILDKGELQVSEKEREAQYANLFRDVATIVAEKCINPTTNRPYTVGMIEKAMRDAHISVFPGRSAKPQALETIDTLKKHIPLERAKMRLRIVVPSSATTELKALLQKLSARVEDEGAGADGTEFAATVLVEPGVFRELESATQKVSKGSGHVEILDTAVRETGGVESKQEGEEEGKDTYDPVEAYLRGAEVAADGGGISGSGWTSTANTTVVAPTGKGFACRKCNAKFASREDHRQHFKSQWHRLNIKRNLKGLQPIEESEFNAMSVEDVTQALEALNVH